MAQASHAAAVGDVVINEVAWMGSDASTSHEWIEQRTGIRERRYVPNDGSVGCSDLALEASRRALEEITR